MKRTTKIAVSLLLALCMALAGCGKKNPGAGNAGSGSGNTTQTSGTTVQEPAMPEPEAVLDPAEIKWNYMPDGSDYIYWYPDGDFTSDYYIIFEDYFLSIDDGGERSTYSTAIENRHLYISDADGPEVDFVFLDNLTCYDLVNGQWYMSADYNEAFPSLTAATFYTEDDDTWNITFYEDGTFHREFNGHIQEGQWWFEDAYRVRYESDGDEMSLYLYYADDSWEVVAIELVGDMYYPAA